ncbi:MAG: response regulator [Bacteroidetes bacterium]|nr:response regulator [Bacteroidota bacterium]
MNALLIHSNNLNPNLVNKFPGDKVAIDYSESIQRSNFILDRFLHEELSNAFNNKEYQLIFIPYTLSQQNYLELTGLRVAAHIRTTDEFNHQYVPIVFVGPETPEQIARLSDLGYILFTSGVFSTASQESDFLKKFFDRIMEEKSKITESEHAKGIERLQLSPPANYQSHHSIDNELALLRWSEYLKCDDRIPEVKENLKAGLYFKYHRVLNPVRPSGTGNPYLIYAKGKVLLIDDEAEKGWKDFYKCFFKHSPQITFNSLSADFKSLSQQDIIEAARKKVEEFDAEVVLLDLRLCDLDFDTDPQPEPKNLTGYKVLEEIKKINKGIQVIITTASNKIRNYLSTHDLGANGYIIKRGDSDVAEDIKNLKNEIEYAIKASQPLKDFDEISGDISQNINKEAEWNDDFKNKVQDYLNISFDLLVKSFKNSDYRRYAYLQLFLVIEEFLAQEHIFSYGDNCFIDNNILVTHKIREGDNRSFKSIIKRNPGSKIYTIEESEYNWTIDVNYKMSAVLIFRYGFDSSNKKDWHTINEIRNTKAAHKGTTVSLREVLHLINFIDFIVNPQNKQFRSQNEGLSQPSLMSNLRSLNQNSIGDKK